MFFFFLIYPRIPFLQIKHISNQPGCTLKDIRFCRKWS